MFCFCCRFQASAGDMKSSLVATWWLWLIAACGRRWNLKECKQSALLAQVGLDYEGESGSVISDLRLLGTVFVSAMVDVGEVNNERGGAGSPFHYLSSPCRLHRTLQQRLRIGVTLWRRPPEHQRIVPH